MTTLTSHRRGKTPPRRRLVKGKPKLGVNQARSSLVLAIQLATGLDVKSLVHDYSNIVDTWVKSRGILNSTQRLKEVYTLALNSMVGSPSVPEKNWIKLNKRGFPQKFSFLERFYLTGNDQERPARMQAVLSVLNWYRGMKAPGTPDLSTITDGPIVSIPQDLIDDIVIQGANPAWAIDLKDLPTAEMLLRYKQGPNGQTTINAMLDLAALTQTLATSVESLLSSTGSEGRQISQTMKMFLSKVKPKPSNLHSKLSIKREGGGKDRVFAMVDYWSQVALKPYHDRLSAVLRTIPQDCTFDQSKGVEEMLKWSLKGTNSSIDLSSASDRFPLRLQVALLENLTGDRDLVEHWRTVMVDRDFRYRKRDYRWSVGQPLGSYSSWPAFALAHHCLVRYCHKLTGHPLEYYLLGDDLVIRDPETAAVYRKLLGKLGVKVSESKSLTGETIEFAKRLFHRGVEVSPVPVPMIHATIKDRGLLSECVSRLLQRSSISGQNLLVQEFSKNWAITNGLAVEKTRVLCEFSLLRLLPEWGTPRDTSLNFEGKVSWGQIVLPQEAIEWVHTSVKFRYLLIQYRTLWNALGAIPKTLQKVELPGTPTSLKRLHPIFLANEKVREDIDRATREVRDYLTAPPGSPVPLPNPSVMSLTGMVSGSKSLSRHNTKVIEITYMVCHAIYEKSKGPISDTQHLKEVLIHESDRLIGEALALHPSTRRII